MLASGNDYQRYEDCKQENDRLKEQISLFKQNMAHMFESSRKTEEELAFLKKVQSKVAGTGAAAAAASSTDLPSNSMQSVASDDSVVHELQRTVAERDVTIESLTVAAAKDRDARFDVEREASRLQALLDKETTKGKAMQQDLERVLSKLQESQLTQVQNGDDILAKKQEIAALKSKVEQQATELLQIGTWMLKCSDLERTIDRKDDMIAQNEQKIAQLEKSLKNNEDIIRSVAEESKGVGELKELNQRLSAERANFESEKRALQQKVSNVQEEAEAHRIAAVDAETGQRQAEAALQTTKARLVDQMQRVAQLELNLGSFPVHNSRVLLSVDMIDMCLASHVPCTSLGHLCVVVVVVFKCLCV
jgi:hypothetical protein